MQRDIVLGHLQQLLESCRVRVDGATRGAGFFVAPGWIVTCAHVSGDTIGAQVQIVWGDVPLAGVVRAASAAPVYARESWPFPDLALVAVPGAPDGHPCALLDGTVPPQGTTLTAVGFSDIYEPGILHARTTGFTVGGRTGIRGGSALELIGNEINHGLSGGAVLSPYTGAVCAVVKATRLPQSPLGGVGILVDALRRLDAEVYRVVIRAHDLFHNADTRWTRLSDLVAAPEITDGSGQSVLRAERRKLLALLAELPPDRARRGHDAAFELAAPDAVLAQDIPLADHRDVFTDLAAQMPPDDGRLPYELRFAVDLATRQAEPRTDSTVRQRLLHQVLITAGRMKLGDEVQSRLAHGQDNHFRPAIVARLRHLGCDRRLYRVMAWRYYAADQIFPTQESPALPLKDAMAHLRLVLREQIEIMGGVSTPSLVELILPVEALDEKIPDWRLWPDEDWFTLGRKQFVVVRPLERHNVPRLRAAWIERWDRLNGKSVGESLVCVCGRDRQHKAALGAAFDTDPSLAALVLAGSPQSGPVSKAYKVAVASGVPMMLWRRKSPACTRADQAPCGLPGKQNCPGDAFFSAVREALSDTPRDTVPEKVRQLRNDAAGSVGADHVGERIVVLWDDPRRQIPHLVYAPAPEGAPR
jgi:hypothetical protein